MAKGEKPVMAKEVKENEAFVNPFDKGVTYKAFLEAVGESSVSEYCKGKLSESQIEWLENDLKHIKTK